MTAARHGAMRPSAWRSKRRERKLVTAWHPESAYLDQAVARAKAKSEESKEQGFQEGSPLLAAGAFDRETKRFGLLRDLISFSSMVQERRFIVSNLRSLKACRSKPKPFL
jgi:hypothetical protein